MGNEICNEKQKGYVDLFTKIKQGYRCVQIHSEKEFLFVVQNKDTKFTKDIKRC